MPIIRPMIGAANNFTAGKLTQNLRKRNINFLRSSNEQVIKIEFQDKKNNHYTYNFDKETALIVSKTRKGSDGEYITKWGNGFLTFSMSQKDKFTQITKNVSEYTQSFWHKLFHRKRQPYQYTEIDKTISASKNKSGYTKKIFYFPNTGITITDIIPHRSYKINYKLQKLNVRFSNVTEDTIEKSIDFQIRRNNV